MIIDFCNLRDSDGDGVTEVYEYGCKNLIRKVNPKEVNVEGPALAEDVNGKLKISLPIKDHYVTIAGLVLDHLGHISKEGESVKVGKITIAITKVSHKHIVKVKIIKR